MDAKFQTIHRQLQAEDAKLLVLAKAVYKLLGPPIEDEDELARIRYELDAAFDFEL